MHRWLSVPPLKPSSLSKVYICKSCNANLTSNRQFHNSKPRQHPDEDHGEGQHNESKADTPSTHTRSQRAQRAADTAATAAGLLNSARSQPHQPDHYTTQSTPTLAQSSSSSSSAPLAPTGALDLRSQAARPSGSPLIRRTTVTPRTRQTGYQDGQSGIRRRRDGYGGNVRGREGTGAGSRAAQANNNNGRFGPQRYRPHRSETSASRDGEDGENGGKSRKFDKDAPQTYMLSDMEIQHLIAQRDKYHGRPQPVKPTVKIEHDTDYFKEVPESGALIRGKDEKKKAQHDKASTRDSANTTDQGESREVDHESSINAAEALITARLRLVACTSSTRYTTRLATRLLEGRYIELFDQDGHIDRVLEAALEERTRRRKKKKTKAAVAADEAKIEELASLPENDLSPTSSVEATGDGTNTPTVAETLHTINDPRNRWRPVAIEPLGLPEIEFLTRELVRGEYDADATDANANAKANANANANASTNVSASVDANASASANARLGGLLNSGIESNGVFKEATRQAVLNSTYLPKDVKAFRATLEKFLGPAGGG